MMQHIKKLIMLLFCHTSLQGNPYHIIERDLLKNFPHTALPESHDVTDKHSEKAIMFIHPEPTAFSTREGLLSLLQSQAYNLDYEKVLHPNSAQDLTLFYYDHNKKDNALLFRLNRAHTVSGEIALAHLLLTPTTSIETLLNRQTAIKWFSDHPKEVSQLAHIFNTLKEAEPMLFSLWDESDFLYSKKIIDSFYGGTLSRWSGPSDGFYLELKRRISDASPIINFAFMYLMDKSITNLLNHAQLSLAPMMEDPESFKRQIREAHAHKPSINLFKKGISFSERIMISQKILLWGFSNYLSIRGTFFTIKNRINMTNYLRTRLQFLLTLKKVAQETYQLISQDDELKKALNPQYQQLISFLDSKDKEIQRFFNTLESPAFQSCSYFFSHIGSILHTWPQFITIKHRLAPLITALGEIDAFLGVSTLMDEYTKREKRFCFTSYRTQDTPFISLTDFWHPQIDPSIAVPNSITWGTPLHKDIILTGPNACGKSVCLKGITLSLLLGQTLGIAPAVVAEFTPFHKISTYLSLVDDVAEGHSLFKAEVIRAQDLLQTIYTLPHHSFAFTAMDELLSGTAPAEGEAAAYGIGYALSQQPHAMSIIATHFPRLTTLPRITDGIFKNYKVYANYDVDGNLQHPFKLIPGRSHQVIALDLMAKKQINPKVLTYAYQFLKDHPTEGMDDIHA